MKPIALKDRLYPQVVSISHSIHNVKVKKVSLGEDKHHNNENEIKTQNGNGNYINSALI